MQINIPLSSGRSRHTDNRRSRHFAKAVITSQSSEIKNNATRSSKLVAGCYKARELNWLIRPRFLQLGWRLLITIFMFRELEMFCFFCCCRFLFMTLTQPVVKMQQTKPSAFRLGEPLLGKSLSPQTEGAICFRSIMQTRAFWCSNEIWLKL